MIRELVLDEDLLTRLGDLSKPLRLVNQAGQVIANLTPEQSPSETNPFHPFTREEIEEAEKPGRRYTYAEVKAHLKSLEND